MEKVSIFLIKIIKNNILRRNYSIKLEYAKCYRILGIPENSDQETIRRAYLSLVKKFHPDSGTAEANSEKFHQIDQAFRTLINKKSRERWNVDEVEEQEIRHVAPQHRQYLNYEGIGSGTPFQRQKQYEKMKALKASENVLQHRIAKVAIEKGALMAKKTLKHNIKTKYGFDRLVEDLIQESISKGDFNNLKGVGKPLSYQKQNPYVDFVTHKLNEVLIDNGFTPEWIRLQKEIREEIKDLRNNLLMERTNFGPNPLNDEENSKWLGQIEKYQNIVGLINEKINKFNLVVPILDKQIIQISLGKEAQKALENGKNNTQTSKVTTANNDVENVDNNQNIFGFIEKLFKM